MLGTLGKISADHIFKYFFSYFSQETGFGNSCKLSPMEKNCMKCQILFYEKSKKNIIGLSSAELAQRVVKVNNNVEWGSDLSFEIKLKNKRL